MKVRFLKIEDATEKKQAHNLAALILEMLNNYCCKTKLVVPCVIELLYWHQDLMEYRPM